MNDWNNGCFWNKYVWIDSNIVPLVKCCIFTTVTQSIDKPMKLCLFIFQYLRLIKRCLLKKYFSFFWRLFHCFQGEHVTYPEAATVKYIHRKFSSSGNRVSKYYFKISFGFKMGWREHICYFHRLPPIFR